MSPTCPWCLCPVLPEHVSTEDGCHAECSPTELIAADPDLVEAIDRRRDLDRLLAVMDFGAWEKAS